MWAAEKLGMSEADAENYAKSLAMDATDPDRNDVFSKLRADFAAAGVAQSDEQILAVMSRFMLEAHEMQPTAGDGSDGAAVMLARKLTTR
jgi:hypothetical protein